MPQTTRRVVREVRTIFTLDEVARVLDASLQPTDKLTGSPRLEVKIESYGVVLVQTHTDGSIDGLT